MKMNNHNDSKSFLGQQQSSSFESSQVVNNLQSFIENLGNNPNKTSVF